MGRPVYVTTSGRNFTGTGPHNVSAYTVGGDGALNPLGAPLPTGAGARGIVFTPNGKHAYIVALEENAVYPYAVANDGRLVPNGQPVQTRGESPIGIAMAPDGRTLYVANQFSDPFGTVTVFPVYPDGTIARRGDPVPTGVPEARNVAVSPDGRFLFVSHGTPGDVDPDVIVTFPLRPDGTLGNARPPVPIGAAGGGIGITPDGRFLYIACLETDDIHGFQIGADGSLTPVPGSPFPAPRTPEGIAMAPDGSHLYVASVASRPVHTPEEDGIWTFSINSKGTLQRVQSRVEAGTGPVGITTTPDGKWLYAGNFFSDNVSGFAIDPVPREVTGSPFPANGIGPAFDSVTVLPNQGPTASFTAVPGRPTRFDATGSQDPDGQVTRYDWDFGDGTTLRDGGPKPDHVYSRPGTFTITLVITDDEGCSTHHVFTGRTALCNGSPAARTSRSIVVPGPTLTQRS
ncbi:6-phosphogluconolactonase (cycloisomerase 2 family) [Kibdelosporangium banguiense]|uniref:6-phosphogluconolactonase (Cycloisomerase 2 family) n=1 Tax=Kibdelosporangium banguiense TaxID=1365924 RepID=A0ABS4TK75_9PSEU|nr:beta-propeller fold lactonase family protein [Kibdelosporangium banguiense]MBP2324817.1 6-phosphogluconolactonase (cycloisomerase 2 family) [Kibdelosporangium banguiense]